MTTGNQHLYRAQVELLREALDASRGPTEQQALASASGLVDELRRVLVSDPTRLSSRGGADRVLVAALDLWGTLRWGSVGDEQLAALRSALIANGEQL